jgi:amino acid adenylation domain-containing protein
MLVRALAEPGSGVDVEQLAATLREPVDEPTLRAAWERCVGRHEVLRVAFAWQDEPRGIVSPGVTLPWVQIDLREVPAADREARFAEWMDADRKRGFAMDTPPLLRLALLTFGPEEHRLVWTFHHALLDGRSISLILREVFATYDALRAGRSVEFAEPPPFRAHLDWLHAQDHAASERFWREQFSGFTTPTPLVIAGLPDTAPTPTARDAELQLSAPLTAALRKLAEREGFTLNTLVQGAWALLLSRYSGEEDVVFGATRACRHSSVEGAAEMVGLFINTLPLRVTVPPDAEVLPWLRGLRAQWIAMRPHEHTPLARVQGWSEIPANRALFDTLVVFENAELGAQLRAFGVSSDTRSFRLYEDPGFGLTLTAFDGAELLLRVLFNRSRFSADTVRRLLGHLQRLLEGIAAAPHARLRELPLLTEAEERQLSVEWNPAPAAIASHDTLHERFARQAARTPDAIALTCGAEQLTYAGLDARATQLATHLRTLGAAPEVVVGLYLDRSNELIVALLGILKAGAAYLPIDASAPPERAAALLADSQSPLLVTQTTLATSLPNHTVRVVCIDQLANDDATPHSPLRTPHSADSLAYIIYTSGSTGRPNGCCITHRNVTRLFDSTEPWFHIGAGDVWTLFHSIAFDFTVWEIWGALLHGGRLVIVPDSIRRAPEDFHALLVRERVTILNQTPSAFRQFIAADASSSASLSLRLVIFGGEALEMSSLAPWFARHGDAHPQLVNMYGITETTVHVTYRPLRKSDTAGGSVIGEPIPDLQLFVLDRHLRPAPIGVPGELFVAGAGLARGYLHRPELTAQRFIENPFAPYARLYRTGDLARWLPGRDLEYLGRIDQQLKIRGHRVEPGEIEAALRAFPGVRDAAVLLREDTPGDKRLAAYVVADQLDAVAMRAALRERLPAYMIPAVFHRLDALPLTANGKLDRRALPAPQRESTAHADGPRTPLETTIASVWMEVLKCESVGVEQTFFDLGGDSLSLVEMHGKLRAALATDLPITTLFQFPTIRSLARHLADRATRSSAPATLQDRAARQRDAFARRRAAMQSSAR